MKKFIVILVLGFFFTGCIKYKEDVLLKKIIDSYDPKEVYIDDNNYHWFVIIEDGKAVTITNSEEVKPAIYTYTLKRIYKRKK